MANITFYNRGDAYHDSAGNPAIIKKGNELTFTEHFNAGGGSELTPATANTLGGVKVGNGLNVASDGTLSVAGVDYSTTEHLTGKKWIDGKNIYEKTIKLLNHTVTADNAFDIISAEGIDKLLSGNMFSSGENGGINLAVWIASDYVKGKSFTTYNEGDVYVTLQYTKPTPSETLNNRTVKKSTSKKG